MEMYGQKSRSMPQKTVMLLLEILFLWMAYWILFQNGGSTIFEWFGSSLSSGDLRRNYVNFGFSLVVFFRMMLTFYYLLERKIPWEEAFSVPFAFAIYYVGFALLTVNSEVPINWIDFVAMLVFVVGSCLNTVSELQRHFWKKDVKNEGKLYTEGLFAYSMHINYFGDILWVAAYAFISRNFYSIGIPVFLLLFFVFLNIPKLDTYLAEKYGDDFLRYSNKTAKLIPYIY